MTISPLGLIFSMCFEAKKFEFQCHQKELSSRKTIINDKGYNRKATRDVQMGKVELKLALTPIIAQTIRTTNTSAAKFHENPLK